MKKMTQLVIALKMLSAEKNAVAVLRASAWFFIAATLFVTAPGLMMIWMFRS